MDLFDARLCAGTLRRDDLENMHFFGLAGAVLVPSQSGPVAGPDEVCSRFDTLLERDRPRVEAAGITAHCMLGLHAAWAPRWGLHKALHRLPSYLGRPGVIALGELGLVRGTPPECDLLARQLELAGEHDLPVVLRMCGPERYALTERALETLLEVGFPQERALLAAVTPGCIELAEAVGVWVGVTVGAERVVRVKAVRLLRRQDATSVILDGGLDEGAGDLLSLPKASEELRKAGMRRGDLRRLFWDNAAEFYGLATS